MPARSDKLRDKPRDSLHERLRQRPRRPLAFLPTPLHELRHLTAALGGPRIWIKRDDLTGLAFGGNKARKLEYLVGDALAQGSDTLITGGAAQSNHCRQTAAAAAACGMACHLALGGSAPPLANGNLLLDHLLGARIHWCGERRKGEDIPQIVADLQRAGKTPYIVPYGGSSAVGALGYVDAMRELAQQQAQQQAETGMRLTHMVFASSSGATHAGMILGERMFPTGCAIVGIRVEPDQPGEQPLAQTVAGLASEAAALMDLPERFSERDVLLRDEFVAGGYGVFSEAEREAIDLLARHEGILLDPVYTGRAMAGLIGLIRAGEFRPDDDVLYWHTGGGPALFAYADRVQPATP